MKGKFLTGLLLTVATLVALCPSARAVSTTFSATSAYDSSAGYSITETIYVTLSDSLTYWDNTEFHFDGYTNGYSDDFYGLSSGGFQGPGTSSEICFDGGYPSDYPTPGLPSGTFDCWAVAHGHTYDGGQQPWSAGVTAVDVTLP